MALRMRIREIAQARPRFGYERIWIMLRREGWKDGRNRVHRRYCLEGLQVRMRRRRTKRLSLHRGAVPKPVAANPYGSMDFVHDQLATGRKFRVLTVIDQWSRESVLLETQFALTGQSVVDALETLSRSRPLPKAITVDHGTEFTSKVLDAWAYQRGMQLDFIRPGKPTENAFIESFNGPPKRRVPQRIRLPVTGRCAGTDRALAAGLQSPSATWRTRQTAPE